jgi:VTC domain
LGIDIHKKDPAAKARSLRYEFKLVCQDTAYAQVLTALRLNPAGLTPLYAPRQVQSIYFDTPHGKSLQENLAGISHRRKIRFRWYHDPSGEVDGHLEMKVRENTLGWKHSLPFQERVAVEGVRRSDFMAQIRNNLTPAWRVNLDWGMEPVQWISYLRDYFISSNGKVRVTVDRNLKSWDQRPHWRLNRKFASPLQKMIIVEVKCAVGDYDAGHSVVSKMPLVVGKSSKFVMASNPGEGPLPSHLGR